MTAGVAPMFQRGERCGVTRRVAARAAGETPRARGANPFRRAAGITTRVEGD